MANTQYGQVETLRGEGIELTLVQGNECIHYVLEGSGISPDADIWTGDRASLIERELAPMGLTVRNGKIVSEVQ